MAKLTDKFFNRVIEGDLELSSADKSNNGITKVVANPTLAGTEAGLEGLEVNGTKYSVKKGAVAGVEGAPSGTLATVLGLDSNGKLAKGSVSGGTKLYKHDIHIEIHDQDYGDNNIHVKFVSPSNDNSITFEGIKTLIHNTMYYFAVYFSDNESADMPNGLANYIDTETSTQIILSVAGSEGIITNEMFTLGATCTHDVTPL